MITLKGLHNAFTLIELLVVIAIISLLVSILLPSLNKAKELAKTVVCSNNLRNMALAAQLYSEDNDDTIPPRYIDSSSQSPTYYWLLAPYMAVDQSQVYQDWGPKLENGKIDAKAMTCPTNTISVAYPINTQGLCRESSTKWWSWIGWPRLSELNGQMVLFGEYFPNDIAPFGILDFYSRDFLDDGVYASDPIHGDKKNYAFGDGHVESRVEVSLQEWYRNKE